VGLGGVAGPAELEMTGVAEVLVGVLTTVEGAVAVAGAAVDDASVAAADVADCPAIVLAGLTDVAEGDAELGGVMEELAVGSTRGRHEKRPPNWAPCGLHPPSTMPAAVPVKTMQLAVERSLVLHVVWHA